MSKCTNCGKELGFLDRKFVCRGCGETFCAECVKGVQLVADYKLYAVQVPDFEMSVTKLARVACFACAEKHAALNEAIRKAKEQHDDVHVYSNNYMGRVPKAADSAGVYVETNWHRDKDEAQEELKSIAKFHGCDIVFDSYCYKDTQSEPSDNGRGTHKYTVFKFKGIAIKSK